MATEGPTILNSTGQSAFATTLGTPYNATASSNDTATSYQLHPFSSHDASILFTAIGITVGGFVAVFLLAFGTIVLFIKIRTWLRERTRRESQASELASSYSVDNYFYDYRDLEEDAVSDIESVKNDNFLHMLEDGL